MTPGASTAGPPRGVEANEIPTRNLSPWILAASVLVAAGAWALDHWGLRIAVLTPFGPLRAQSPLYAFWAPVVRPQLLVFAALIIGLVRVAPALCSPQRTAHAAFVTFLVITSLALPLALLAVRDDLPRLGSSFEVYRNEEFYDDAVRLHTRGLAVGQAPAALEFVRGYVEAMPRLSLHGQHFPPLNALWLYLVRLVLGPGVAAAGASVLAAFAVASVLVYLASRHLLDEVSARQATMLALCSPSMLDFACTSMDAVFLMWAALAWWLAVRSLADGAGPGRALLAGFGLAVAAMASFSALPVGLALLAFAGATVAMRRAPMAFVVIRVATAAAGFLVTLGVVRILTGFAWWDCLLQARSTARTLMRGILGVDPSVRWLELSYGNASAFAIGAGVSVIAVTALLFGRRGRGSWGPWTYAALATLAVMAGGGIYSMETERVWVFAIPWLTTAAMAPGPWDPASLRLLLAAAASQALAMEVALFTIW